MRPAPPAGPGPGPDPGAEPRPGRDEPRRKITAPGLRGLKLAGRKITAVTAYDALTASLAEAAGIDVLLVGDSLANTALGHPSTIPVTLDEMLVAVRAVARATRRALLVADMPFGTYQASEDAAVDAAVRFVKSGAEAVKLEGGAHRGPLVRRLVENGIPVMGHIGLTPQSLHAMGGYKVQGRDEESAARLERDAEALAEAGVFSLVLEGIPSPLAATIHERVAVPAIGIGAGPDCDGQILVIADLLGLSEGRKPRFVRRYAGLRAVAVAALERYRRDVTTGEFPAEAESYSAGVESAERAAPR